MSRGDWWSVLATLVVTGAGYFAGGRMVALGCFVFAGIIGIGLHLTRKNVEGVDLWLGFDGVSDALLCIQNRGKEPVFDAVVRIPEDGSCFASQPIARIDPDGAPWPVSGGTRSEIRKALAMMGLSRNPDEQSHPIPIRITFSNLRGKPRIFDDLEIELPFSLSSIRRKTRRPTFRRLAFWSR